MLLKTKDRKNERSQTKPIKATKLLKTKENGYERSHYVVENKGSRKRTQPNEPESSPVSQLLVCGRDLLAPPHPRPLFSRRAGRNEGRVGSSFSCSRPHWGRGRSSRRAGRDRVRGFMCDPTVQDSIGPGWSRRAGGYPAAAGRAPTPRKALAGLPPRRAGRCFAPGILTFPALSAIVVISRAAW
jgi:hypothetical protein